MGGAGSVVFHAIDCPRAAGDIEINLDINVLSEEVTNDLLKISLTAEGTTGDKLLCMDIGVQSAAELTMEDGSEGCGIGGIQLYGDYEFYTKDGDAAKGGCQ